VCIQDASAKLIKKDELEMSTGINNEKHNIINIYNSKLLFTLLVLVSLTGQLMGLNDDKKRVIVIDPGHGGYDPGALGTFSAEKNITLAIALKTGSYIEQKRQCHIYQKDRYFCRFKGPAGNCQ
jgi:N-acetylmuramoyl-L-alanine amidase